jgi:hypothetical protein
MKMSRLISLASLIGAIVAVSSGVALAQTSSVPREFRICTGDFAVTTIWKSTSMNISSPQASPATRTDPCSARRQGRPALSPATPCRPRPTSVTVRFTPVWLVRLNS